MNKTRRKILNDAKGKIILIRDIIQEIWDDEQDYYDNMPDPIKDGVKGDIEELIMNDLEEVVSDLDEAIEILEEVIE